MNLKYVVEEKQAGKLVKQILKSKLELSERIVKRLKYADKILLNSVPVHINAVVKEGDLLEVNIDFVEECEEILPENIDIDILYEDEFMIVLNKQPGLVVHPTSYHTSGTIANALLYHYQNNGISKKIRPVSRLDKDTSGTIIFAKNEYVQEYLIRQMADKTFKKEYIGIVSGVPENLKGTINLPIERMPGSIIQRQVSPTGAQSITHYEIIEAFDNAAYLKFNLETGRTHQIRVHCQALGHPLIGDTLYSDIKTELIERQALHSYKVSFIHPRDKRKIEITAPIPEDIENLLLKLRVR